METNGSTLFLNYAYKLYTNMGPRYSWISIQRITFMCFKMESIYLKMYLFHSRLYIKIIAANKHLYESHGRHYSSWLLISTLYLTDPLIVATWESKYFGKPNGSLERLLIKMCTQETHEAATCIRTYAVVVVGEDEPVVAAAVEGTNRVAASSVPTGISLTLIYV